VGGNVVKPSTPDNALTLWPEWAWAIHNLDKRVENRGWKIPLGRWFALHAGGHIGGRPGGAAEEAGMYDLIRMAAWAGWGPGLFGVTAGSWSLQFRHQGGVGTTAHDPRCKMASANPVRTSAILGVFRVTEHQPPEASGPWKARGQIGNVFEYVPLATPVPCKGAQGLWTIPPDVRASIAAQLQAGR
jgi:hypothetical protein